MAKDTPIIADYKFRKHLYSLLLITAMGLLLCAIWGLIIYTHDPILLVLAGIVLFSGMRKYSAQKILDCSQCQPVKSSTHAKLLDDFSQLASDLGITRVPVLYSASQPSLNAFSLQCKGQSIIVVSEKLLNEFGHDELMAVLAHELSHIYHDDIQLMHMANRMSQLTQCLTAFGLVILTISPVLHSQDIAVPWQVILSLLLAYNMTTLLQLCLSRVREFYADIIAVQLTRNVSAMVSALRKIEQHNGNWFNELFTAGRNRPIPALLHSHPPTQDRVRCLLGLEMLSGFKQPMRNPSTSRQFTQTISS